MLASGTIEINVCFPISIVMGHAENIEYIYMNRGIVRKTI
jgi:hypothetical protein